MPTIFGVVLVCVATFSVVRVLAVDAIAAPLRDRLEAWAADGDKALDSHRVPSRKSRAGAWLTELFTCPWCLGMWVGLAFSLAWWAALSSLPAPLFWVPTVAFVARITAGLMSLAVSIGEAIVERLERHG